MVVFAYLVTPLMSTKDSEVMLTLPADEPSNGICSERLWNALRRYAATLVTR